ncbi:MAG: DUF4188 domain-containing protein [Ilumatobacteraceae bacterium]|nr:DUF4188 domain-containing protein [Ilumatobacteraceae bacterium]
MTVRNRLPNGRSNMGNVNQGRWTAEIEGDFVVFIIGGALNSKWQVLPGDTRPWRPSREEPHVEVPCRTPGEGAPQVSGSRAGHHDRTGIWHETFLVRTGEYAAIYRNTRARGLGKATMLVPVAGSVGARQRLRAAVEGSG